MQGLDDAMTLLARVRDELDRVVLGQGETIEILLAAVCTGGHVLIEDRPGVGKTTLARSLADVFGLEMKRIQGTTDLLPTDITGIHVFQPNTGEWSFRPGPVLSSMVLIDEFNRATPKAQSALLEAMAEGRVSIDGETIDVPQPHVVIATQNPTGESGTHRLVQAQLDRFAVRVELGRPQRDVERRLLDGEHQDRAETVSSPAELAALRSLAAQMTVAPEVKNDVLDVVDALRRLGPEVWLSTRVPLVLLDVARGLALLDGRSYVAPDDVRAATPPVVGHRLPAGIGLDQIARAVSAIPVP